MMVEGRPTIASHSFVCKDLIDNGKKLYIYQNLEAMYLKLISEG